MPPAVVEESQLLVSSGLNINNNTVYLGPSTVEISANSSPERRMKLQISNWRSISGVCFAACVVLLFFTIALPYFNDDRLLITEMSCSRNDSGILKYDSTIISYPDGFRSTTFDSEDLFIQGDITQTGLITCTITTQNTQNITEGYLVYRFAPPPYNSYLCISITNSTIPPQPCTPAEAENFSDTCGTPKSNPSNCSNSVLINIDNSTSYMYIYPPSPEDYYDDMNFELFFALVFYSGGRAPYQFNFVSLFVFGVLISLTCFISICGCYQSFKLQSEKKKNEQLLVASIEDYSQLPSS